jgi:hypothetical protein
MAHMGEEIRFQLLCLPRSSNEANLSGLSFGNITSDF